MKTNDEQEIEMKTNRIVGKHVRETEQEAPLHLMLKSRATAALAAGCLALSMCPALAYAAPNADASQEEGRTSIERQMPNGGQESDGQHSSDGRMAGSQMPSDRQMPTGEQPSDGQRPADEQQFGKQPADGQQPSFESGQMPDTGQAPSGDQQPSGEERGGVEWAPSDFSGVPAPADDQAQPSADGQAPADGQYPSDGQASSDDWQIPERDYQDGFSDLGQRGPRMEQFAEDSAADAQVRDILTEKYGAGQIPSNDAAGSGDGAGAPGGIAGDQTRSGMEGFVNVNDIPAVPEGEANVQEVIDTTRDIVRGYGADALEKADFSDKGFLAGLTKFTNDVVAQRAEMFENNAKPENAEQPGAPNGNGKEAGAKASSDDAAQSSASKPANENVSASVLDQIIEFLAGLFGFSAK